MNNIYISVVLPAYNTPADILRRAINSVLNQTYPYFELIIVDDGSEPSLDPIIKEYHDNRIVFIRHKKNKGAGAAHNIGIKAAKHDWVAFICHDDEWLSEKLEKQAAVIPNLSNDYGLIYTSEIIIGEIDKNAFNYLVRPVDKISEEFFLTGFWAFIFTSSIIVKKDCFFAVGFYDESGVLIDWDLYYRLSKKYKFYFINEKLVIYYYTSLGITHYDSNYSNPKVGNNNILFYKKWKQDIFKYKTAKKSWSIRWNAIAKWYLQKSQKKEAFKAYWEAIKLNPFWRGNYIDLIKYFILRKQP
ncbi:MAG TPA: glycosyltransferase [Bacteroidales bacterium]|nr:glycosyltransferase [Bacteroidales bacterium]